MRRARMRGRGHHYVHTISRVIDRRYIFGREEKDYFCKLVREQSLFSGIAVVTLSVLSNHFHLLLEQVDREKIGQLSWQELEKRLSAIYNAGRVQSFKNEYDNLVKINDPALLRTFFERFEKRMYDVSTFMKELKQKFTQWYNRRNHRKGTLWEERFKSVIVEGAQNTLLVMAAYIDLNPVRAGMVSRVEEYRWCGYGAAVGGDILAQEGLGTILDQSHHIAGDDFAKRWQETARLYRLWLYQQGREVAADPELGIKGKKGFSDAEIEQVIEQKGELSIPQSLRHRLGYLSESKVFGTKDYVDREFARSRSTPAGSRRGGVKHLQGSQWEAYRVL